MKKKEKEWIDKAFHGQYLKIAKEEKKQRHISG